VVKLAGIVPVFVITSLSGLDMQTSPANIAERVPAVAVAKFHPSVGREPVIVFNGRGPNRQNESESC
jgi:hypothetical protein